MEKFQAKSQFILDEQKLAELNKKAQPYLVIDKDGFIVWINENGSEQFLCRKGIAIHEWFEVAGVESSSLGWFNEIVDGTGNKELLMSLKTTRDRQIWFTVEVEPLYDSVYDGCFLFEYTSLGQFSSAISRLVDQSGFYRYILDHIPADIAVFDNEMTYKFLNKHAIPNEEVRNWMIGKTDFDFVRLRNLPYTLAMNRRRNFDQLLAEKKGYSFEEKIEKNGVEVWNLRIMSPIFNAKNEIDHVIGYGLNSTKLHQFEKQIRQQGIAIDSTSDGIALLDSSLNFTYVNEAFFKIYEWPNADSLIGEDWKICFPTALQGTKLVDVKIALDTTGKWKGEISGLTHKHKVFHAEMSLAKLEDSQIVCTVRDISDKKEQAAELDKLAIVASKTNSLVFITNSSRKIEWVNEAFTRITGYSAMEAIGKMPGELLNGPLTNDTVIQRIADCAEKGIPFDGEILNYTKSGKKIWMFISSAPVFDERGELINFVNVETDISILKETEENALKLLDKERELSELKSRFVNLASHEFRTPLTSILSSVELVQMMEVKGVQTADKQRYLNRIIEDVDRMTEMMNNFLQLGQYNAGQIRFKPECNDFVEFIEGQLQLCRDKYHTFDFPLTIEGEVIPISFDKHLLGHVFQNLISNAIKYTSEVVSPEIKMEFIKGFVRLEVIDHGIGIPEKEMHRLFNAFYRAGNTDDIQGTGLGLVLVKQFVELHKGQIYIHSEESKGTVFTIQLPVSNNE